MRRTGTFSLLASLGIHAMLLGAVVLCIGQTGSTPPKIHLVYGEVGSEESRGEIWAPGAQNPPQIQVQGEASSGNSTEAMDAELMGGSVSALGDAASQLATPLLMTADGGDGGIGSGGEAPVVPKFHYSAPGFASEDAEGSSGRAGASSGTDVASIPRPIYPKESRKRGEQGTVLLEVVIGSDGSIGEIKIIQHPGHERLVSAAIEAIRKARIEPAIEDGKAIASVVRVPFNFVLR
jgi:TonB family protein